MLKRPPAWVGFLIGGMLFVALYLWLPDNVYGMLGWDAVAVAGAVAIAVGIRRNRPEGAAAWWLLMAGQLANVTGDIIYFLTPDGDEVFHPYDVSYLLGYVLQGAGVLFLLRRRGAGRDWATLVDSMIITSAFALLSWVFLMKPVAAEASLGLGGQMMAIAYPAFDLLLVAMVAWLLTADGSRNIAFFLVATYMVAFLVGDYFWAFANQTSYDPGTLGGRLIDCTYLAGYVALGAGALHPGMVEIGRPAGPQRAQPMTMHRLVLLTAATLIAPALLAWQAYSNGGRVLDAYAIVAGSVVMFLLVIARMTMLVRQVQAQAAVLADHADLLHEAAQRDPLTDLPNRRAWNAALPSALQHAARHRAPLTLAILDLDHFKAFNDTYGHQTGDRLLTEATAAWSANLRSADVLARYGGEEFVALLPGITAAEALDLLDRLRPLTPMGCTFSAGVATWDGVESGDELLGRADQALYRAKDAGRDRVVSDDVIVAA
ncbi:GGDEF domain-containing protein [Actinoplanes sp. NPDC023714]|uniref:GGDEF domain-containing protein n=1 Tax=Actinoplanes sp. NPDC023714 TaxID=3154322 RepID=UPI0034021751